MGPYLIPLRNEKVILYNRIILLILVIHLALFGYMAYSLTNNTDRIICGIAAFLLAVLLLLKKTTYFQKKENELIYIALAEMLITPVCFMTGYAWFAVLTVLISTLYFLSRRPLVVQISKEQVIYPSFPPKKINWSAIDALVLKDGLISINFKNDRLVQQYTETDFSSRQEQEINEFCRQQLNA